MSKKKLEEMAYAYVASLFKSRRWGKKVIEGRSRIKRYEKLESNQRPLLTVKT